MIENPTDPQRGRKGRHNGSHHAAQQPECASAIRQIAVLVDETDASDGRLALACHLANACDAALIAVAVQPEAVLPEGWATSGFLPSGIFTQPFASPAPLNTWHNGPDVMTVLEQRFKQTIQSRGCRDAEWRVIGHGSATEMLRYAKLADLTILGQQQTGMTARVPGFPPDEVALASGRPTLIVPAAGSFEVVGNDVAVAWDGSGEASRALTSSLPLLRDASSVLVLEVGDRRNQSGPDMPGPDSAVAILARHGVQAFGEFIEPDGASVVDTLHARVVAAGVDLLVCGLFHHTRTRERLLGGVTQDFLGSMIVPVLVSH